ncbi:MAG: DUF2147 domain-containing protein [Gammaproteobacteria bacterium]|nr:DUF2147 domain-containing protein [Gammaproteobacteria bacterium]MDE2262610.1 DUF2147 domain-containing protein [Gammaproteobacteria bacterium]
MMRFPTTLAVLVLALAPLPPAGAADARLASPVGLWQPLDSSGRPLGLIRIFEAKGLYYGRIEPSSPTDDRNARCTHCTGHRHGRPIIGLLLMRHLRPENGEYVDGDILDPDTGRIYGCSLRLTDGGHQLIMRGFLGISLFGRSQTWQRVESRRPR